MTTNTNVPRLWLLDLQGDEKPGDLALIACATCPHAMWQRVRGRQKPVAFCRVMHRETYSGEDSAFIEVCDGRLEADSEDL
jgi:hypothetical protein